MTITVQAIYRNGVLQPQQQLDLPDNTPVQVQITTLSATGASGGSLFGAFPELAALTADDFDWVKRSWERGLEKQTRLLSNPE